MARKVVNRKELRRQADAAEEREEEELEDEVEDADDADDDESGDDDDDEPKAKKKKAPAKKKARTKTVKEVRLKAFWGVFNQSMKRVALFEYSEKKAAQKKADELTTSQKTPHFIQPVKEVIS
ncbi:MAG: hypothetical protein JNM18_00320 [Planctomycetaceae bacterium]|nr:hypothetical protein [Planctomycetaceae bacterium]